MMENCSPKCKSIQGPSGCRGYESSTTMQYACHEPFALLLYCVHYVDQLNRRLPCSVVFVLPQYFASKEYKLLLKLHFLFVFPLTSTCNMPTAHRISNQYFIFCTGSVVHVKVSYCCFQEAVQLQYTCPFTSLDIIVVAIL